MKTGIIYIHTNLINNKSYIGSTIQSPNRRWRKQDNTYNSYKNCSVFFKALCKYSWDNFKSKIIETDIPITELYDREEFYIKKYNTLAPNGYNLNEIIEGQVELSLTTRQLISKSKIGQSLNKSAHNKNKHIIENGIIKKLCTTCNTIKQLNEFGKYKSTWDGLNRKCKTCHNKYRKRYNSKKLTEDELRLSYKTRSTKARPFIGIDDNDNIVLKFESGLHASKSGYDKTQIRRSILNKKKYKNYWWK